MLRVCRREKLSECICGAPPSVAVFAAADGTAAAAAGTGTASATTSAATGTTATATAAKARDADADADADARGADTTNAQGKSAAGRQLVASAGPLCVRRLCSNIQGQRYCSDSKLLCSLPFRSQAAALPRSPNCKVAEAHTSTFSAEYQKAPPLGSIIRHLTTGIIFIPGPCRRQPFSCRGKDSRMPCRPAREIQQSSCQ
jgi:hypothetical protein